LIESGFGVQAGYDCSLALDYFTEISEHLLPPQEANEKFFRLIIAMLDHLRAGGEVWRAVDYFTLWAVRLSGILPELRVTDETAALANEMFAKPLSAFASYEWNRNTMSALRRALVRAIEQHVERRLLTVPLLETI
jgi:DNA repair protein RecO (recombination protein O)